MGRPKGSKNSNRHEKNKSLLKAMNERKKGSDEPVEVEEPVKSSELKSRYTCKTCGCKVVLEGTVNMANSKLCSKCNKLFDSYL